MKQETVRRIVWTASIIGLVLDIVTTVIVAFVWSGVSLSGAFFTTTATALIVATLALQATFLIAQLFPNGRAKVPLGRLQPDGWVFVIASTAIPGVVWGELGQLAIPSIGFAMPRFVTPLFTCLLLLIGRMIQQRRMAAIRE